MPQQEEKPRPTKATPKPVLYGTAAGVALVVVITIAALAASMAKRKQKRQLPGLPLPSTTPTTQVVSGDASGTSSVAGVPAPLDDVILVIICVPKGDAGLAAWCVRHAMLAATHPQNLHFGVHIHAPTGYPQTPADFWKLVQKQSVNEALRSNVHVMLDRHKNAPGLSAQRSAVESTLYRGEKYVLWIHANVGMINGWDELCKAQLALAQRKCKSEAILSHKPLHASLGYVPHSPEPVNFPCFQRWSSHGTPIWQWKPCVTIAPGPVTTFTVDDAFLFAPASLLSKVPSDPGLNLLPRAVVSWSTTLRCYTHGYSFMAPSRAVAYHCAGSLDTEIPAPTNALGLRAREVAYMHVWSAMEIVTFSSKTKYVCGNKRTLASYAAWSGLDWHIPDQTKLHAYLGLSLHRKDKQGKTSNTEQSTPYPPEEAMVKYPSWKAIDDLRVSLLGQ